ncbi:hypothetical protein [Colwellia sp. E2M01]|uniref:hypothetical protein n=1 Tax=Colwellia sp. E2M01 TaxID=2841561 RepID=UPI001C093294|nr:hypothetical protein [Colwellia sp. E2M01]MBU2872094.1 hypothetical protein [Colwellia sp. E2M01]
MIDDEKLQRLIDDSEFLLEGLPKSFWRLIKLSIPEIWDCPDDYANEHNWVVAIMGNNCIIFDDENSCFCLGTFIEFGQIESYYSGNSKLELQYIIENIVSSRFKIS